MRLVIVLKIRFRLLKIFSIFINHTRAKQHINSLKIFQKLSSIKNKIKYSRSINTQINKTRYLLKSDFLLIREWLIQSKVQRHFEPFLFGFFKQLR